MFLKKVLRYVNIKNGGEILGCLIKLCLFVL